MKKLMMFAAAMTIVGGAYAGVCNPGEASPCDTPVWDFVMKGKTANGIAKGYKAVYSISYKGAILGNLAEVVGPGTAVPATKTAFDTREYNVVEAPGTPPYVLAAGEKFVEKLEYTTQTPAVLAMPLEIGQTVHNIGVIVDYYESYIVTNETLGGAAVTATDVKTKTVTKDVWITMLDDSQNLPGDPTGECCLETFNVYVYDKEVKDLWVFEDQEVNKMSVFGKGLEKGLKPGGKATLESDVMWQMEGDEEIALQFVGFGKAKYRVSKGGNVGTICDPDVEAPCEPFFDWPSWSGWFTGFFGPETADSHDLNCEAECIAVAGGTWSAKLNKKLSAAANPEAAIYRKFKVSYIFDDE